MPKAPAKPIDPVIEFLKRLAKDGIRLISDLQRSDERELMRRYGAEGQGPSVYLHDPEGNGAELLSHDARAGVMPARLSGPHIECLDVECGKTERIFAHKAVEVIVDK